MPRRRGTTPPEKDAILGFEAQLWDAANALRGSMDAAEYKHVVLGLIFLKYISDAFESHRAKLEAEREQGADPEDPDEYRADNVFWVPSEARWSHLQKNARQPTIGKLVDAAMEAIERHNPSLKGVLPKDYARPALDQRRLGQLIDLLSNLHIGQAEARAKDVLGRVYEYFLSQFASAEGKKGGEFYTRVVWSSCWWRCWSPTAAVFMTLAAVRRACSCSRWSLSERTPAAMATAEKPRPTSLSTGKSSTTPLGAWLR